MRDLIQIDYSCLVGSQVLMEFWDSSFKVFQQGFLEKIEDVETSKTGNMFIISNAYVDSCRIYQHPKHWISNVNGDLVLPDGLMVRVIFSDGNEAIYTIKALNSLLFTQEDIDGGFGCPVNVQVTGPAEGYKE
jgi:hypothetical protein